MHIQFIRKIQNNNLKINVFQPSNIIVSSSVTKWLKIGMLSFLFHLKLVFFLHLFPEVNE